MKIYFDKFPSSIWAWPSTRDGVACFFLGRYMLEFHWKG